MSISINDPLSQCSGVVEKQQHIKCGKAPLFQAFSPLLLLPPPLIVGGLHQVRLLKNPD